MANTGKTGDYFVGLDIGTDSVGYAVTDPYYMPLKAKGEPMLGVTTFEAGNPSADRRAARTARRRLDRKQQRVALLSELFALPISKVDPKFFLRRRESALFRTEAEDPYTVFNDVGYTDQDYHRQYPTIHHLLCDLMASDKPHDVRLVYLACAWLVAHRGHFLFDVSPDKIDSLLDFNQVFDALRAYLCEDNECGMPWDTDITADDLLQVLRANGGVTRKKELLLENIWKGKKPKKNDDTYPFGRDAILTLLAGGTVKPAELLRSDAYEEVDSVSLSSDEETFAAVLEKLGDDGELLLRLRALFDCATLIIAQGGKATMSEAKVAVYEQHKADLAGLKAFVRKYAKSHYNELFRDDREDNYTAYTDTFKQNTDKASGKFAGYEAFAKLIKTMVKGVATDAEDKAFFEDMLLRLDAGTFLPKQRTTDNRVIPQQLYYYELQQILDRASGYLPFLTKKDADGITAKEKILAIFRFRIPYFVGPLNPASEHAWIVRKPGKIYPWNFEQQVDLDASEELFIKRMTASCTYVAGASVLPEKSLLYTKFAVLNQLNPIKVNGIAIPVSVKQELFTNVMQAKANVRKKDLESYLISRAYMRKGDELSGVDEKLTATLSTWHRFRRLLESGQLSEADVEAIVEHAAYSEDRNRMRRWLERGYPRLSEADRSYILKLNLKGFGRLSAEFLTGTYDADPATGEAVSIMDALWNTNRNLMQLLSDDFGFRKAVEEHNRDYYAQHPASLSDRLEEMYISNSVKRPIIRTLAIMEDITKARGEAPAKIFVEMARDAGNEKKGKRTSTRKEQLLNLYKRIKTEEVRILQQQLDAMGAMADNRLQSDKLFLYYLQLGKCLYTGKPIDLAHLSDSTYNIDHIYPQALVKDDSLLNNRVLVDSKANGEKKDVYPLDPAIQGKMRSLWDTLRHSGLMTDEKFRRLTRVTAFTDEEKLGFINRQLVETRQSTKAVAALLKERYPDTEIVYVKAGLVSEFRQEYGIVKARSINNLHHAKDAYLNIVVGNVYDSRFSKNFFNLNQKYSLNTKALFNYPVKCLGKTVWQGEPDIAKVKAVAAKNHIHVTRYAFCRHGSLFDLQPVKAKENLVPLKKDLPTEQYGGYNRPTASFFYLVRYTSGKKRDVRFISVDLAEAGNCLADRAYAEAYVGKVLDAMLSKPAADVEILLDGRPIKVNTMLELDGLRLYITGTNSGGKCWVFNLSTPLILSQREEAYIKAIESFRKKRETNKNIKLDSTHDHITPEQNLELYHTLKNKLQNTVFKSCPTNQHDTLEQGTEKFANLCIEEQLDIICNVLWLFAGGSSPVDLSAIGGVANSGIKRISSNLNPVKAKYRTLYIIDQSASGIYETRSCNLLELL